MPQLAALLKARVTYADSQQYTLVAYIIICSTDIHILAQYDVAVLVACLIYNDQSNTHYRSISRLQQT